MKPPRRKPLARSQKPIKRVPVKKRRSVKRFAGKRLPEYAAWIRTHECIVTGLRTGTCVRLPELFEVRWSRVEATHVTSRGAGGLDAGNLLPLDADEHRRQHRMGIKSWAASHGWMVADLHRMAADYWTRYSEETRHG